MKKFLFILVMSIFFSMFLGSNVFAAERYTITFQVDNCFPTDSGGSYFGYTTITLTTSRPLMIYKSVKADKTPRVYLEAGDTILVKSHTSYDATVQTPWNTTLTSSVNFFAPFYGECSEYYHDKVSYTSSGYIVSVSDNYYKDGKFIGTFSVTNGNIADAMLNTSKEPSVQVYVGDTKLTESDPKSADMTYCNSIEGFDDIKMFWNNQSKKTNNFSLYAIKKGFLGIQSEVKIDDITSYTNSYKYRLAEPSVEYTYKLLIDDDSSPCLIFDGFTGRTRFYYFKFSSPVKSSLVIKGVTDGNTVSFPPSVSVVKENTVKQYSIRVNNNLIYTFSQSANETFNISKGVFNLGLNNIAVYDGITLVKGLSFTLKPSGTGTDGTGTAEGPGDDEIGQPKEEYEPPDVDTEKPTAPTGDDFSKWVLYYLQSIIYWLTLPFKLLAKLLKDICTNVIDIVTSFVTTYSKLTSSTTVLFGFLPASVTNMIAIGFGLSIILFFVKLRR